MSYSPVVVVDQVTFAYQQFPILRDVAFSVNPGEFIGIIGPNGGGKTTLLKLILGFLKPTTGKVTVFDQSPSEVGVRIGYVPQAVRFDRLFPISVLEVVLLGRLSVLPWYGWYRSADKKAALEALEKVGIVDLQSRAFGTLSGGQAQRALIARALVSKPDLLILDEPTASIDSKSQNEVYALLKHLHKQDQMTILMVTHDLNAAIEYVERVLCVQQHVLTLQPREVCEHFALGLYHPPLIRINPTQDS